MLATLHSAATENIYRFRDPKRSVKTERSQSQCSVLNSRAFWSGNRPDNWNKNLLPALGDCHDLLRLRRCRVGMFFSLISSTRSHHKALIRLCGPVAGVIFSVIFFPSCRSSMAVEAISRERGRENFKTPQRFRLSSQNCSDRISLFSPLKLLLLN